MNIISPLLGEQNVAHALKQCCSCFILCFAVPSDAIPSVVSVWLTYKNIVGRSMTDITIVIDDHVLRLWQTRWVNSLKGRLTFGFVNDVTFATEKI